VDACEEVHGLLLGWERSPRWISLRDGGDEPLRLPVTAVLARTAAGWVLLETGLPEAFRDPAVAAAIYDNPPELAGGGEADPLLAALAAHGVEPGELAAVAVSHLHADHAGGLRHVIHGAPVHVQRRELSFALGIAGPAQSYWRPAYDRPGLRWRRLQGDGRIAPGIHAISTPGHTPGHMSYLVRRRGGAPWLFAVDAIDLAEGVASDTEIGWSADPADAPLRRRSHERLLALAEREGARLIPGHDPGIWADGL
jgi:glyoxylase-like metal-dependent hydrolase (beta-lactamase superfamily II)